VVPIISFNGSSRNLVYCAVTKLPGYRTLCLTVSLLGFLRVVAGEIINIPYDKSPYK
jgi:hypothetical protein